MGVLDKFKNYFTGNQKPTAHNPMPIFNGRTTLVDAGGDMVYATCLEIMAKNIGRTKWGVYGDGEILRNECLQGVNRVLNCQPYPGVNAYDFWRYMELSRLATGNALAYIKYDKNGMLEGLIPLDGASVTILWDDANILEGKRKLLYEYIDPRTSRKYTFLPEEILHLKAYSANGISGRKAINVLYNTLKSSAEVEAALRDTVRAGYAGSIVIKSTANMNDKKRMEIIDSLEELFDSNNSRFIALDFGLDIQNINNDIKGYYEILKNTNAQAVSSFFGVPLCMLNIQGGTGAATFSATQMQQFYNQTVSPIIEQYAAELTVKLLTRRQIDSGLHFDTTNDSLDFLDAQAKVSTLAQLVGSGIYTPNEARASLKMPPSKAAGADILSQIGGTGAIAENTETSEK